MGAPATVQDKDAITEPEIVHDEHAVDAQMMLPYHEHPLPTILDQVEAAAERLASISPGERLEHETATGAPSKPTAASSGPASIDQVLVLYTGTKAH